METLYLWPAPEIRNPKEEFLEQLWHGRLRFSISSVLVGAQLRMLKMYFWNLSHILPVESHPEELNLEVFTHIQNLKAAVFKMYSRSLWGEDFFPLESPKLLFEVTELSLQQGESLFKFKENPNLRKLLQSLSDDLLAFLNSRSQLQGQTQACSHSLSLKTWNQTSSE